MRDAVDLHPSRHARLEARLIPEDPDPDHPHLREYPEGQEKEIQGKNCKSFEENCYETTP